MVEVKRRLNMAKKRVLRGTSILEKFIKSNGTDFPNSFNHFVHDGDMEYTCVLCQKEEHLTYLEINRGIHRAYACKVCAGVIKRENNKLFKKLDSIHTLSVPEALIQYIKTGLVPSTYLAVANWDSVGKKTNKCFFCSKQHVSMVNFQAPVGQFTQIHRHVMICSNCNDYIKAPSNTAALNVHLEESSCCTCGEEYYITENELVNRLGITKEEYADICKNSPDSTISQYKAYLDDYRCFNCLTSNGYENVHLKTQLECNDCGDPAIFNTHHRVPPPDANEYICDNCKNRRVSTLKGTGTQIGDTNYLGSEMKNKEKTRKLSKERLHALEIEREEKEKEQREREYGIFSHRYAHTNIRYIIRRYKNAEYNVYYYYVIYEHVYEPYDISSELPFRNENMIDTPYGTLSVVLSSLDKDGPESFPEDIETMYKCIDAANMASLDLIKNHKVD